MSGENYEDNVPDSVKQYNKELAEQKNRYTIEEMAEIIARQKLEVKDYQKGEKNFVVYNGHLYEKRMEERRICQHCQNEVRPVREFWYILGKWIEKKEGGLEKSVNKKDETPQQ